MKVIYDHQIYLQEVGGISRYFQNLIATFEQTEVLSFFSRNIYSEKNNNGIFLSKTGISILDNFLNRRILNEQFIKFNELYTIKKLNYDNYSLIHVTDHHCSYLEKIQQKRPVVLTMHDLIPELFPSLFSDIKQRIRDRKYSIQKADRIICISESTKKDLINIYDVPPNKVSMIYHGAPDYLKNYHIGLNKYEDKKYIMYIGNREAPYKNFWNMIENLDQFFTSNIEFSLVCVGAAFTVTESAKMKKYSWNKRVTALRVDESELFSIYKNSLCLIFPSLYEGFGFPLLEAMKAGCPILASDTSCLPEIAAGGAKYFNPVTFTGFAENLKSIIEDSDQKKNMLEKQAIRLNDFSWKKTAYETYDCYLKVL